MWVEFNQSIDGSLIICSNERYFVACANDGRQYISPAKCSHRGGPLHMGEKSSKENCIRCPWHGLATSEKSMERRSLPAVRVGTRWRAKLPEASALNDIVVMPIPKENAGDNFLNTESSRIGSIRAVPVSSK